ncbi:Eco57I restriction-modification methylase domain-containing protein [Haploplasma modicum]|uniref:Eco57I restriction-modification methylase domain-containing protein n=1 Tax=Haploplasma modicum TaxID=2150 RepID=UPI00054FE5A1|nr:DEAD/DEAH box helicase family protein [Haploplasma modicum]
MILKSFEYNLIYIFRINIPTHKGILKIGETTFTYEGNVLNVKDNTELLNNFANKRIKQYTQTANIKYELLYTTVAIDNKGNIFNDKSVQRILDRSGFTKVSYTGADEWYKCDLSTAINALEARKLNRKSLLSSEITQGMSPIIFREEQEDAIIKTVRKFTTKSKELKKGNDVYLWNAKMRFGKTLTSLEVIKRLGFTKTIIATHRPVVSSGWYEEFNKIFYDEKNYIFGSETYGESFDNLVNLSKKGKNIVYFASMQFLRNAEMFGGNNSKTNNIFDIDWDFLIVDEAHEGILTNLGDNVINELRSSKEDTKTLFLSGTPFNLLSESSKYEFEKDDVFTWDYIAEQHAKINWEANNFGDHNPYAGLPRLNIFTYDLTNVFTGNNYLDLLDSAFNFREFFRVWTGVYEKDNPRPTQVVTPGEFVYKEDVKRFLDLLVDPSTNYPFSTREYRDNFRHTLWMLPGVKEARALSKLLKEHKVFGQDEFIIVNVAGDGDEEEKYEDAKLKVDKAIGPNPDLTRTITLSCGKLTTGVTIKPWTAALMLSGSSNTSASSYLQTIFRVQSPANINGRIKTNSYVFDFAPDRTLKMIAQASQLSIKAGNRDEFEKRDVMREFLNFCPVIGIQGSSVKEYDVNNLLVQLKQATIDSVVRNGFDDVGLYNDGMLLSLTNDDISLFNGLNSIIKASDRSKSIREIVLNKQGLDNEKHDEKELRKLNKKPKKELTPEEKEALALYRKQQKDRLNAIKLLRAISIRIPLLIYGADVPIDEEIDIEKFSSLVDDNSWVEFMPRGVTKDVFNDFKRFFDNEVFVEAGKRIRKITQLSDSLPVLERVDSISELFSTFKNPDRETVLTPWSVVNKHLGETIGGHLFFENDYYTKIFIDTNTGPKLKIKNKELFKVMYDRDSRVLDVNSKTGLYPLFVATSIYLEYKHKGIMKDTSNLWEKILSENIFIITKTEMAALITKRTLIGYKNSNDIKINILTIPDINEEMNKGYKDDYKDLIKTIHNGFNLKEENKVKFNAVVGNPPYQTDAKQQIYTDFYLLSRELANVVSLIFPTGWQEPKNANNLAKMNNEEIKRDKQIVFVDNRFNVFPGISGAEWTNFILWVKNYDNNLDGQQLLYTDGLNEEEVLFPINQEDIEKPKELVELSKLVNKIESKNMIDMVSSLMPYGLRTDFLNDPSKYNLPPVSFLENNSTDIRIYGLYERRQTIAYIDTDYDVPRKTISFDKYKVFIGKAWGNWSKNYLGGAYSDIIVARPSEICTENFLEVGPFDNIEMANNMAKYLMTRFARGLLYLNKYSQDNSKQKFKAVPIQTFEESWWSKSIKEIDNHLFEKYSVPSNIKKYVFDNVQEKTTDNILITEK